MRITFEQLGLDVGATMVQALDTMSDLTPQQIVAWFRNQAKKFTEMADFTEQTFSQPIRYKRTLESHYETTVGPAPAQITAAQLEESVRKKGGRVKDLAERLKTDEATIEGLLDPGSRVYKAERGWLKLKE
jgi:hypothetical protein